MPGCTPRAHALTNPLRITWALLLGIVLACSLAACGDDGKPIDPPSALRYSAPATLTVGASYTFSPVVAGTVDTYSVSPGLPAGLALNATTGVISGTPSAVTASRSYTVTAKNAGGSTSADVSFGVNPVPPAGLSYATPVTAYQRFALTAPLTPTVTGAVASYAVSPALPAGLALDATTGVISGTPTVEAAQATYTITAANAGGSTTFPLVLKVVGTHTVSATVAGLSGAGVALQLTGGDRVVVTSNGSATFRTRIADGATYEVTVSAQPLGPEQLCRVANGSGTIAGADVTNVAVTCVTPRTYLLARDGGRGQLWQFEIDTATGAATPVRSVSSSWFLGVPPNVVATRNRPFVYVLTYMAVTTMTFDLSLERFGEPVTAGQTSTAKSPITAVVHPNDRLLYVAEDAGGGPTVIEGFAIDQATGALTKVTSAPFTGGSYPYPIMIVVDRTGRYLVAMDMDSFLNVYAIDAATGALTLLPSSPITVPGDLMVGLGSNPSADFVYTIGLTISGTTLTSFALDVNTGSLTTVGTLALGQHATVPFVHPTGGWLYTWSTNVMGDPVYQYALQGGIAVDPLLRTIPFGRRSHGGFAFTPDGRYAYAGATATDTTPAGIVGYAVDASTGAFTPLPAGSPTTTGAELSSPVIVRVP